MIKADASAWKVAGGLVAALALYWFIGGDYADHSLIRNVLVVVQFLFGLWMVIRGMRMLGPADASGP